MADLNEVRLIGRLTRDPELRSTSTGQMIASFGLATGRKFKTQEGVLKEDTTFVEIQCWGKMAEISSKHIRKSSTVFVGGRLKFDSWEDKQTGQKRTKLYVIADNLQFLDRKAEQQPMPSTQFGQQPMPSIQFGQHFVEYNNQLIDRNAGCKLSCQWACQLAEQIESKSVVEQREFESNFDNLDDLGEPPF